MKSGFLSGDVVFSPSSPELNKIIFKQIGIIYVWCYIHEINEAASAYNKYQNDLEFIYFSENDMGIHVTDIEEFEKKNILLLRTRKPGGK